MHQQHRVLRVITKIFLPFILLFGLYVQFHGDFGPGGGFQAGVIFAAGIILYALVFGLDAARRALPLPLAPGATPRRDRQTRPPPPPRCSRPTRSPPI